MPYELRRSARKSISLEITPALTILVRAPRAMPQQEIDAFVTAHADWIEKHIAKRKAYTARYPEPDAEEIEALRAAAAAVLPPLVERYAAKMGVRPTGVRITGARRRFGSCSGKNALCFSYRLMRYPPKAVEYVVVHELAHIRHHDHSPAFYRFVESVMPDYRERAQLLRE